MSATRYHIGDTRTVMATLEPGSVDLVLSSPPFLALRSYLPADHPDKVHEMGSEATPAEFIDGLLDVAAACRRLLAPHGTLAFELGDTYSGSGGAGGDYNADGLRDGAPKFDGSARRGKADGWPLAKSLTLVPEAFRLSLAYGRNILTGAESPAGQWRIRNVVRWCRPNPPVGALGDKFRPATSEMVIACTSARRWFDLDAVRNDDAREPSAQAPSPKALAHEALGQHGKGMPAAGTYHANGGAPPLDWWEIPTEPYSGSHYATWPRELLRRPILAMCPQRVCRTCGEPSRRIVGDAEYVEARNGTPAPRQVWGSGVAGGAGAHSLKPVDRPAGGVIRQAPTIGWTDCGHNDWRPGMVLDPFGGTGTTAVVANGHGRDCTLIDLDARNADLARERVGMFCEVVQ